MYRASWNSRTQKLETAPSAFTTSGEINHKDLSQQERSTASSLSQLFYLTDNSGAIVDRVLAASSTQSTAAEERQPFQWSAGKNQVDLGWWTPKAGEIEWSVSRDGQEVFSTTGTTFRDDGVDRSEPAMYLVEGTWEYVDDSGEDAEKHYRYGVSLPAADDTALGRSIDDPSVRELSANEDIAGLSASGVAATAEIDYSTFIADRVVSSFPCPEWVEPGIKGFLGDNRGFSNSPTDYAPDLSFRTLTTANITIDGSTVREASPSTVATGLTRGLDGDGNVIREARASTEEMSVAVGGGPVAQIDMVHRASDPLCKVAPAVDAIVTTYVDPTGTLRLTGKHDGAPHHELTYRFRGETGVDNGKGSGCAYRWESQSLASLLPPAEIEVDISWVGPGVKRDCPVAS